MTSVGDGDGEGARPMTRAAIVGVAGAVVIGLNAGLEVAFAPTQWTQGALVGVVGATSLFGFFAPATLSLLGDTIRARGPAIRRAAFWSPYLVGAAVALTTAAAGGFVADMTAVIGLVAAGVVAAVAQRALPTLAETPDGYLAPALLFWTLFSSFCVATLADIARPVTELMVMAPALCGVGAVLIQVFHRAFSDWSTSRLLLLTGAGIATGAGVIGTLASWLPTLNSRLKLAVAASVLVAVWAAGESVTRRVRPPGARPAWAVAGVALVTYVVMSMTTPVGPRFGGLDPRSTAGGAVALASLVDDRDGDRFYSEAAGGNDCDDAEPRRTPLASSARFNCLPRGPDLERPLPSPDVHDGDVVVIIVDALRADLFTDEEQLDELPGFGAFAAESVRFTTAYSPGNSTFTSLPSMLTGLSPNRVMNAVTEKGPGYDELVEGQWFFDAIDDEICSAMIAQSHDDAAWLFDYYPASLDGRIMDVRVDEVMHSSGYLKENVSRVLDACAERRMALVLYADDPHLQLGRGHACAAGGFGGFDCYMDEVRAVDAGLTEVIEEFQSAGRWDNAAVILTSDHGEAFGERGHVGHTSNVYEEQVRVPLWVRVPGVVPRVEPTPVSGLSVAPTATELLGGEPRAGLYPSLVELVEGRGGAYPPPIAESATGRMKKAWTSPQSAMRKGQLKLMYDWQTAHAVVFDLSADPDELRPLARHAKVDDLKEEFLRLQHTLLTERRR